MLGIRLLECSQRYYILRHHLCCRSIFTFTPITNDSLSGRRYHDLAFSKGKLKSIIITRRQWQINKWKLIYIGFLIFLETLMLNYDKVNDFSFTGCHGLHYCLCSGSQKPECNRKSKHLFARSIFNRAAVHSHGKQIVANPKL